MLPIMRVVLFGLFAVLITGCSPKEETFREEVEIIKISGTLPQILNSTGAIFDNDSVKIGEATLVFTIKEQNGHIRTLEVLDGRFISKVALISRVCVGSKFSMTFTVFTASPGAKDLITSDPRYYVGKIIADDILVKEACLNQS